jgi:PAS domain S-box-containing protein
MNLIDLLSRADLPEDLKAAIAKELSERRNAESALEDQKQILESILGSMSDGVAVADLEGKFILFNRAAEGILGLVAHEASPDEWSEAYGIFLPDRVTRFPTEQYPIIRALRGENADAVEIFIRNPTVPQGLVISVNGRPWRNKSGQLRGAVAVFRDITPLKLVEDQLRTLNETLEARVVEKTQALRKVEDQFRQAQKMEAMGRLAGGVAHDFNNLLTVINGYSELLLAKMTPDHPMKGDLEEVLRAGTRAAGLTRQLLAFSRKQVTEPKILDLNTIVSGMQIMLQRLIGADVELVTVPGRGLWRVHADPGHLEKVIVNLAVNARDAMPRGGKLTIETQNVEVDDTYVQLHAQARAGSHVRISVSDTGTGMDLETLSRLFEPFFTTKEVGKGTGLGLSTVHGIVRQSGGHVEVYSDLGKGSTFKVYLPRAEEETQTDRKIRPPVSGAKGSETILVAEDSDTVRRLCEEILRAAGYRPLSAKDGEDALRVAKEHPEPIHLLLTDTIMSGIGGAELGVHVTRARPGIRVLFMSGYTDRGVEDQGLLEVGAAFLQKPFTREGLLGKIREVLDVR